MPTYAEAFAKKCYNEMISHQEHENDARVDAAWLAAIRKVFIEHECPDCMYSVEHGHRS